MAPALELLVVQQPEIPRETENHTQREEHQRKSCKDWDREKAPIAITAATREIFEVRLMH